MNLELAKALVEIMENAGEEVSLYEDYCGRGMFGIATTGIVVDNIELLLTQVIANASVLCDDVDGYSAFEDIGILRSDNLANQVIVY